MYDQYVLINMGAETIYNSASWTVKKKSFKDNLGFIIYMKTTSKDIFNVGWATLWPTSYGFEVSCAENFLQSSSAHLSLS